jgi:p-methyltransferase
VFIDDTFNVPPKRFKELCRMMIEEDLGLNWYAYFRCANAKDQETFDLAAASGCAGVFLGVESADNTVLGNMRKLTQDAQYREGIAQLNARGITTFAALIAGFPGETEESVRTTIEFVEETRPDFWRVQPWWGNPRSPIYLRADELRIRGERYTWSHYTMDSTQAAAQADRMFDAVRGSTWLPLYDMDFWSLPYLTGKGVGTGELKDLLGASREVMRLRDAGRPMDAAQRRFEELVLATAPAPAKYT